MERTLGQYNVGEKPTVILFQENQNAPRSSEHPPLMGKNVKTFRWDQRLQIQNLFMAFKQVPRCR